MNEIERKMNEVFDQLYNGLPEAIDKSIAKLGTSLEKKFESQDRSSKGLAEITKINLIGLMVDKKYTKVEVKSVSAGVDQYVYSFGNKEVANIKMVFDDGTKTKLVRAEKLTDIIKD